MESNLPGGEESSGTSATGRLDDGERANTTKKSESAKWTCRVRPPSSKERWWHWDVADEPAFALPSWLKIERIGDESLAASLSRARLDEDSITCNGRAESAFRLGVSSYQQVFRVWLTDLSIAWIEENVTITRHADGTLWLDSECFDATDRFQDGDGEMEPPAPQQITIVEAITHDDGDLQERLSRTRETLDLVVRGGRWFVWSCDVTGPTDADPLWNWMFRDDFSQAVPVWFDVERKDEENLAWSLGRARIDEDAIRCNSRAQQALKNGLPGYAQTFRIRLRDDRIKWVDENVIIHKVGDSLWHLVGICIDATQRKNDEQQLAELRNKLIEQNKALESQNDELRQLRGKLEAEKVAMAEANVLLEGLATIDGLTAIKNHRAFQEQLENTWHTAVRHASPLSVVMLDIDSFKQYNDTFGHPAGDDVLKRVARILQESARDSDFIARYGGEEFSIILPLTDRAGAIALAERFRAAIDDADWEHRHITASFGVATLQPSMTNAQTLLMEADRALYRAKKDGRDRVCWVTGNGDESNAEE